MVRISVDVSLGTFVKLEERTISGGTNKAKLIRELLDGWMIRTEERERDK